MNHTLALMIYDSGMRMNLAKFIYMISIIIIIAIIVTVSGI